MTQPPSQDSGEFRVRKGTAVPVLVGGPGSKFLACLQPLKFTHGIGELILFSTEATSLTHKVGPGGAAPSPRDCGAPPAFTAPVEQAEGWERKAGMDPRSPWLPGLEGLGSTGASGIFPLGLGDATSFVSELGVVTPWCTLDRERALGGRMCYSKGCSREWRQG